MPGPGCWGTSRTSRRRSGSPPHPSRSSSALRKSPAVAGQHLCAGWQERLQRHTVEHVDVLPYVQILGAPVPQFLDSAMDFFRRLDLPVAEQVIEVPTISSSLCPSRAVLREPQMAEQLVDVPIQHIVELLLNHPVPQVGFAEDNKVFFQKKKKK